MSRVSTTNPFDLLGDEDEVRSTAPAQKKEQKPAAPAAAKPAASTTAAKPAAAKPAASAPAKPAADSKAAAKPATGNSANQTVKPAPVRDANQNLQERPKESRAPRDTRDGPRAPRAAGADGGKRANDRKSGTGRPQNEVKKGGSGKGNWGGDEAKEGVEALQDKEGKTAEEAVEEDKEEKVATEGDKKDEAAKEGEKKDEPAKEPETRTLEEYLASKKKTPTVAATLKPRTVEDQDFSAAGFVPLQRGESGTAPLMVKEKKEKKPKKEVAKTDDADLKSEKGLAAQLLNFASHQDQQRRERGYGRSYEDRPRGGGRGGRGGRGGGRGGYHGNRDDRDAGSSQPPVQEKDFPSLSPHTEAPAPVKA